MQRAAAYCLRMSKDPDVVEVASEFLASIGLSLQQRMAAEDPCPAHGADPNSIAFMLAAAGVLDAARVGRGERSIVDVTEERMLSGAAFHQLLPPGRA